MDTNCLCTESTSERGDLLRDLASVASGKEGTEAAPTSALIKQGKPGCGAQGN